MLLNNITLDGIVEGRISVVFRVWKRPTVRTGGTLKTRKGVLNIIQVEKIDRAEVTAADLQNAGLASVAELCEIEREGDFYRITLGYRGEDPRISLRENIDEEELRQVSDKLRTKGEWPKIYLEMIDRQPNVPAQLLADAVGLEKPTFKAKVRVLKSFGLTISLRPGYRLSRRGEMILEMLKADLHK